jgi:hypothetical protein
VLVCHFGPGFALSHASLMGGVHSSAPIAPIGAYFEPDILAGKSETSRFINGAHARTEYLAPISFERGRGIMTSGDKSMALDQSPENCCTRIRGRLMRWYRR